MGTLPVNGVRLVMSSMNSPSMNRLRLVTAPAPFVRVSDICSRAVPESVTESWLFVLMEADTFVIFTIGRASEPSTNAFTRVVLPLLGSRAT